MTSRRPRRRRSIARCLGAAAVLAGLASATVAGAARVQPLYSTRQAIRALAQDGTRVAWVSGRCSSVHVLDRAGHPPKVVGNASSVDCGSIVPPRLALAGTHVLWTNTSAGNGVYTDVMTAAPGQRQRQLEQTVGARGGGDGDYVTDLAGDGSTLVYATVAMTKLDTCIDPGTPCFYFTRSGRVKRVIAGRARLVPSVPPAAGLAVWKRRIAVLVASSKSTVPRPTPSDRVEVHDAVSGKLLSSFRANGVPLDVALGPTIVAVLVRGRCLKCELIELHSERSGAWLAVASVPNNAAELSMSGRNVVFRSGRSIRFADTLTHETGQIAVARSNPIGLSIDGGRVVWGERTRGTSRIVSVTVD